MWYMGLSFSPGKGKPVPLWENPHETHKKSTNFTRNVKASTLSVIRGELRDVLTGLVWPEHPSGSPQGTLSGRETIWQKSMSTGTGTASMASAWGLGRAGHHSITFVPCASSEAPGRHLAQATLSQSDEKRGRRGSDTQQRCSRVMSPKAGTVSIH